MEVGPFRGQRSAERAASGRSEQLVAEEPKPAPRQQPVTRYVPREETPSRKPKWLIWVIIAAAIVVLGVAGWLVWSNTRTSVTGIDSGKYQAVFFTNGQVYFGKLQALNNDYMKMTDIYYLQTQASEDGDSKNPQETASTQSDVQLIKLGQEIHGPEDAMIISRDQVLFYENLKADGKVAQSIANYKKQ